MVMIDVGSPKMAREMLCAIQTQIDITQMPSNVAHGKRLQSMIDQLDIHRPLGVDGKHGDLHTETCGCEDQSPENMTREYWTVYVAPQHQGEGDVAILSDAMSEAAALRYIAKLTAYREMMGLAPIEYRYYKQEGPKYSL